MRTVKFDRVAVAEISVNLLENPPLVKAKGAFINTQTGATHGYTTCTNWSAGVLTKLSELREAMEQEMATFHFEDAGPRPTTSRVTSSPQPLGLGEHLGGGEEDVPQG